MIRLSNGESFLIVPTQQGRQGSGPPASPTVLLALDILANVDVKGTSPLAWYATTISASNRQMATSTGTAESGRYQVEQHTHSMTTAETNISIPFVSGAMEKAMSLSFHT